MKKLIAIVLGILTLMTVNSQVSITADGKKVENLQCDMKEVSLSFVLPSNYKNYEKINVLVEQVAPEIGTAVIQQGFYQTWTAGYFEGKSAIDVELIAKDGTSELSRGFNIFYALDEVCYDPMRNYTYLENHFYVRGAVHNGWEWKDGEKVKKYSYEIIEEYVVKHEIAPILDYYFGANRMFTFDKLDFGEFDCSHSGNNTFGTFKVENESAPATFDFGAPAPKAETGEVKLVAEVFSSDEYSLEDCTKGVELNLVASSNESFPVNGGKIPFDHQSNFYAKQTYLPVTPGGVKGKKGGKLSKSDNEAWVQKIATNTGSYFDWKDVKLGDLNAKKLEIQVYDKDQVTTNDAWATYVKSGEEDKTRSLIVYVGQKGNKIYCVALYKTLVEGLTTEEEKFITNFEKTFKANL